MSVLPVAQGGMDARMGEKNSEARKQRPATTAVRPVRPPTAMPAPLSMKAVTGEQPRREPAEMQSASTQKASVDRGKSPSPSPLPLPPRVRPQKRAIEYSVAVQSIMST